MLDGSCILFSVNYVFRGRGNCISVIIVILSYIHIRQKSKKIADETVNEISIENEESDTNGLIPILIDVSSDELRFTLLKSAVFHSIKSGNIY